MKLAGKLIIRWRRLLGTRNRLRLAKLGFWFRRRRYMRGAVNKEDEMWSGFPAQPVEGDMRKKAREWLKANGCLALSPSFVMCFYEKGHDGQHQWEASAEAELCPNCDSPSKPNRIFYCRDKWHDV